MSIENTRSNKRPALLILPAIKQHAHADLQKIFESGIDPYVCVDERFGTTALWEAADCDKCYRIVSEAIKKYEDNLVQKTYSFSSVINKKRKAESRKSPEPIPSSRCKSQKVYSGPQYDDDYVDKIVNLEKNPADFEW